MYFKVANSFDSNKGSEIASSLLTIYWPTKFKTTDITNSSQIQDILLLPTGLVSYFTLMTFLAITVNKYDLSNPFTYE